MNKLNKLDQIMQQVIQEMYNLKDLSMGTLETIKRMKGYDKALQQLKGDYEKEKEKAKDEGQKN